MDPPSRRQAVEQAPSARVHRTDHRGHAFLVAREVRRSRAAALGRRRGGPARHSTLVAIPRAVCLAILTRAPGGGGKTRLFEALGFAPDPALLEALLPDTVGASAACGLP